MKAPSVIIGVGGIGSEICARTERMLPASAPDSGSIRFVIMDTDVNTLRDIQRRGFGGVQIQLTDNITVKRCLECVGASARDWYPDNMIFARKSMTEGAGQQRTISRLALEYALQEGKLDPLYAVIRQLHELTLNSSDQQIRFYIISSLAGGTGSGIILPLSLHLNRFIRGEVGDALSSCKGFFVLSSALKENGNSRLEQKSIDANAYAAVKELSAFMQISDGDLERYRSLRLAFSQDGAKQKYIQKSYDYCFLFGMANQWGMRMHSLEDLKDMVAEAVYMQACSPIQDRNSSREDNTIKHIISRALEKGERHLRRFGGIGCGELVYPYESLKRFYALQWAMDVMEDRWQRYDKIYFAKDKKQREDRRLGRKYEAVKRSEEYINAVDHADRTDFLAYDIQNACRLEDGSRLWDGYLKALWTEVCVQIDKIEKGRRTDSGHLEERFCTELNHSGNENSRHSKRRENCINVIKDYGKMKPGILALAESQPRFLCDALFTVHPLLEEQPPYHLEYWLNKNGQFLHPNAVRYFLYQLKDRISLVLEEEERRCQKELKKINDLEGFEIRRWGYRRSFELVYKKFQNARGDLYEYVKHKTYFNLLKECRRYAGSLTGQYEEFYETFDDMKMHFQEECLALEEELDRVSGTAKYYICADRECREKMLERLKSQRGYVQVSAKLSYRIFDLMHKTRKDQGQRNVFVTEMERHWIENLEQEYDGLLNMNILHAISKEEQLKTGRAIGEEGFKLWIGKARSRLILPFLQYAKTGGQHQEISICCFNSELLKEQGICRNVVKWLQENNGVDDPYYCSVYQLIFYCSFVGIGADEVLEYFHEPDGGLSEDSGKAFRFYEETLEDMGKSSGENTLLTPHMSREWHSLLEMPDPDSSHQQRKEAKIAEAFLYAVLRRRFKKGEGETYSMVQGEQIKSFENLKKCHEYLYENQWIVKELLTSFERELQLGKENGQRDLLDCVESCKNGIFQILIDYHLSLDICKQDGKLCRILVEGIKTFLERILTKDEGPDKEELEKRIQTEWKKKKIPKELQTRAVLAVEMAKEYFNEQGISLE